MPPPIPTATPVATPVDPLTLLIERLGELREAIEKSLDKPVQELNAHARVSNNAFTELGRLVGRNLPEEVQGLGKAFTMIGGTLRSIGPTAIAAALGLAGLVKLGEQLASFVRLADPAGFQLFARAAEDFTAIIGQSLAPILELVTRVVRMTADSMGGLVTVGRLVAEGLKPLLPALEVFYEQLGRVGLVAARIAEAMLPAWVSMSHAVSELFRAFQPLVDLLIDLGGTVVVELTKLAADGINVIVPAIVAFARALAELIEIITQGTRDILSFLGVNLPNDPGTRPGASVGAAMRPAQIGSVDSVLQNTIKSAFSLGNAGANPAARTASAVEMLNQKADEIIRRITELPRQFAVGVADALSIPKGITPPISGRSGAAGLVEFSGSLARRAAPAPG